LYCERYVEADALKSRASIRSRFNILTTHMGDLPATALEQPQTIEDFRSGYIRKAATTNRFLSQLRHMVGWAIGRGLLERSPFGRYVKVRTKGETRRERRLAPTEEEQLLKACDTLLEDPRHKHLGMAMRDRLIGALDTCCRRGEMLLIRNADVDWSKHWIAIRAEHAKDGKAAESRSRKRAGLRSCLSDAVSSGVMRSCSATSMARS
jgi:integrase